MWELPWSVDSVLAWRNLECTADLRKAAKVNDMVDRRLPAQQIWASPCRRMKRIAHSRCECDVDLW